MLAVVLYVSSRATFAPRGRKLRGALNLAALAGVHARPLLRCDRAARLVRRVDSERRAVRADAQVPLDRERMRGVGHRGRIARRIAARAASDGNALAHPRNRLGFACGRSLGSAGSQSWPARSSFPVCSVIVMVLLPVASGCSMTEKSVITPSSTSCAAVRSTSAMNFLRTGNISVPPQRNPSPPRPPAAASVPGRHSPYYPEQNTSTTAAVARPQRPPRAGSRRDERPGPAV